MNNIVEGGPPFVPAGTVHADNSVRAWHDRYPALLIVASVALGLAAGGLVGWLVGWAIYEGVAGDCHGDGWCELGAALYGLLAGVVVGSVAHIAAGAAFIHRFRQPGRRWLLIMIHCAVPIAVLGLLALVSGV